MFFSVLPILWNPDVLLKPTALFPMSRNPDRPFVVMRAINNYLTFSGPVGVCRSPGAKAKRENSQRNDAGNCQMLFHIPPPLTIRRLFWGKSLHILIKFCKSFLLNQTRSFYLRLYGRAIVQSQDSKSHKARP